MREPHRAERGDAARESERARRITATTAFGAHALHDGFGDLLYVLLPVWQHAFGLTYGEVGLVRSLFSASVAGLQIPAGMLAARIGHAGILALGTCISGLGFLLVGTAGGLPGLGLALLVAGTGSSVQHPVGSDLVAAAYPGPRSRAMLGAYNFAGDLGKMALPSLVAVLLIRLSWQHAALVIAALALLAALAIWIALGGRRSAARREANPPAAPPERAEPPGREGFLILLTIGMLDSATRMAFLLLLPFVLAAKGADLATTGFALTLVFAGGAAGKLVCGALGARIGVLATVALTEIATACGMLALLLLPQWDALILLPVVGVALNGTSSVLYGSVPELVAVDKRARAFGYFYTGTIGAGALAPIAFGRLADGFGIPTAMAFVAAAALFTLPLAWRLNAHLDPAAG